MDGHPHPHQGYHLVQVQVQTPHQRSPPLWHHHTEVWVWEVSLGWTGPQELQPPEGAWCELSLVLLGGEQPGVCHVPSVLGHGSEAGALDQG